MTVTKPIIVLDLGSGEAMKQGSLISASFIDPVSKTYDLIAGSGKDFKYATLEPDTWVLDGSHKLLTGGGNDNVGVVSDTISDSLTRSLSNGGFYPEVVVDFGSDYTISYGLELHFPAALGSYCDEVRIVYKSSALVVLADWTVNPTGYKYSAVNPSGPVSGVRYVYVVLKRTSVAQKFGVLLDIKYDTVTFIGDEVQSATVVENVDTLSTKLPMNSLELTVVSESLDFNILDPQGLYANFKAKQKVDAYESIDGVVEFIGRFYLDDWNSVSPSKIEFLAYDAISLLDKVKFYTPGISSMGGHPHTYAYQMVDALMDLAGVEYELDASLSGNIRIWNVYSGMLRPMSCRDALKNLCFSIGAYVNCSASKVVRILPFDTVEPGDTVTHALDSSNSASVSTERRPDITAVEVVGYDYAKKNFPAANELFNGALTPGDYFMTNESPSYLFVENVIGSIIINPNDAGPWWIDFTVTVSDTYKLTDGGFNLEEQKRKVRALNDTAPAGTKTNEVAISSAYLLRPDGKPSGTLSTTTALMRLFRYYLQRFKQKSRLFGVSIHAGDSVSISIHNKTLYGIIEQVELDLAGGLTSSIVMVGDIAKPAKSVKYNNTSSKFTYFGFPNTDNNALHYQGDMRWSPDGQGGFIEFYIIGYQFKFIYRQLSGGLEGAVKVYIDDVLITTIDQNGTTVYQKEWASPVMDNTYHKVKLEKSGTTGTANMDAVEVFYK